MSTAPALPDLYNCVDPAISEILIARNVLQEQMSRLDSKVKDLAESRVQKQAVSLALAAEDLSKTAFQIQELAKSMHRGIAQRLKLEERA